MALGPYTIVGLIHPLTESMALPGTKWSGRSPMVPPAPTTQYNIYTITTCVYAMWRVAIIACYPISNVVLFISLFFHFTHFICGVLIAICHVFDEQ